jgi:hypothetical protein
VYFIGTARRWQAREKRWLWRAGLKNWRLRGHKSFVIPGRAKREPGIHNHDREYGFRACAKRRIPE